MEPLFFREDKMSESLWLAIGLVLLFEGLGPMLMPKQWKRAVSQLITQSNNDLRRIGGCLFVTGLVFVWFFS